MSSFAKLHTSIDDKDLSLVMRCRKSLLFFGNKIWKSNSTESCFDVTVGCFDCAEICELVRLYTQSKLEYILPKTNFGLYRDDGLVLLGNFNDQQMDKKRKAIIKNFKDISFSIDIQTNLKEIDFLDVTMNLKNGTYRTRNVTISFFTSTHRGTIHCKSSNSYQIPSLKDCRKILLTKKFLIQ